MKAIKLALSLILVPRLFLSLIFLPFLFSIILVIFQLFLTRGAVYLLNRDSQVIENNFNQGQNFNLTRKMLYGDGSPLKEFRVCNWIKIKDENGVIVEQPAEAGCELQRLNVAIRPDNLTPEKLKQYELILKGNTKKLHICETCISDLVISLKDSAVKTSIYSIWGLMIANLAKNHSEVKVQYIKAVKTSENLMQLIGDQFIYFNGLSSHISISEIESNLVLIINIAGILIVAAWLALKAHKKILDYFSKSGALLPLVAANGKENFYIALWIITAIRVSAFLMTALPVTIYTIYAIYSENVKINLFDQDPLILLIWFLTLFFALSFATLIASISDLKQRYSILGIIYKFVPIMLSIVGLIFWSITFIFESDFVSHARFLTTSLPIIGLGPVLATPIVKPNIMALIIHCLVTIFLFKTLLSKNGRWFAAHLEDL